MDAIRIISTEFYDRERGRFQSCAFDKSSGEQGGISILDRECILESGRSVCEHMRHYYGVRIDQALVFWQFSTYRLAA